MRKAVAAAARWPGSSTPHNSRAECMDSTGMPDIDRADAQPGGDERTDGRAARHGVLADEDLTGHTGGSAGPMPGRCARGVGGVALVGVDLEGRATVGQRLVRRVVAVEVVGVRGVGDVDREAPRASECRASLRRNPRPAGSADSPAAGPRRRWRSRCRSPRGRNRRTHRDEIGRRAGRRQQCRHPGVHRGEIVQPGCSQQLQMLTEPGRRGQVVDHQVVRRDLVRVDSRPRPPGR